MSNTYTDLPLTSFPDSMDTFAQFLDMTSSDYTLVKNYQEAMERGDFNGAQSYLAQIPQGVQKLVSALRLNELREAILAVERFYSSDVEPYIDTKQIEWVNRINQFTYKGTFSPSTSYIKNNIVRYSVSGVTSLYINISDVTTPIGTTPVDTQYWLMFTQRGTKGESGTYSSFDFAWDSSKLYNQNTIVTYNNRWWNALAQNQNQEPTEGNEYWELILTSTPAIYPVQSTQPAGQVTGELWFKII